jgi:hypothetical protein
VWGGRRRRRGENSKFKIFGEINTILGILANFCNRQRS